MKNDDIAKPHLLVQPTHGIYIVNGRKVAVNIIINKKHKWNILFFLKIENLEHFFARLIVASAKNVVNLQF